MGAGEETSYRRESCALLPPFGAPEKRTHRDRMTAGRQGEGPWFTIAGSLGPAGAVQ